MTDIKNTAVVRTFQDIAVGDTASLEHTITVLMVDAFVAITRDSNPLHTEEQYAQTTHHKKRVVHGMLTASLLSELVGMHLPGKFSLILSQTTQFILPVFIDDTILVTGTVTQKSEATHTVTLSLSMTRESEIVLRGTVVVLLEDSQQ